MSGPLISGGNITDTKFMKIRIIHGRYTAKEQHILKLNDGCDAFCYRNKENSKTSSVTGLADNSENHPNEPRTLENLLKVEK